MASTSAQPLVIGLTGPFGAGVSTVSRVLETFGFHRTSLSSAIRKEMGETVAQIPLQERRRRLQDIGNEGRRRSRDYWLEQALAAVDLSGEVVIDSIRNHHEIDALRRRFTNSLIIAVIASKDTRWDRVQGDYDGNAKFFDQDDRRDADEEDEPASTSKSVLMPRTMFF